MNHTLKSVRIAVALSTLAATSYCEARPLSQPSALAKPVASRSWVSLKASMDQTVFTPGEPIQVYLTATNNHKSGAYLRFTSGQRFDFSVSRAGESNPVYTWSATRMFSQEQSSLWLKPGEFQKYEANIGDEMGNLAPGKYQLRARLSNSPRAIVAAPIDFVVKNLALSMTARTDKVSYKIGEPVQVDVAVTNHAAKANHIQFNSGLGCDVRVSDEAGNVVWTYGANLRFIRVLGDVVWEKGETKNYAATWNGVALPTTAIPGKLSAGRYRVQAVLQSTPALYAAPVYIDITE